MLTTGVKLGPYEIISPLGAGGMGEVWRARDTRLSREVAVKVLPASFANDVDRLLRFEQEARATSALNHPNIVTIYELGEVEAGRFIVMELVEGRTLRALIDEGSSLDALVQLGSQMAKALGAAHAAGITHRDIKPENIMVRPDGVVKVLDFGLAKLTESPDASAKDPNAITKRVVETDPGVVMGTVSYMSPEQARGVRVDARTDIFSFGVVIYEMIAGRVPFEGASFGDVISGILGKRPMSLARFAPDVPPELERIVSKALAKDRDERYQTIKDMLIDLKRLKRSIDAEAEFEDSEIGRAH